MQSYEHRHPQRLIVASAALSLQEKALLLALVCLHSFDAEDRCGFQAKHWSDTATQLGIKSQRAARIWMRLRDARVIVAAVDRNAPFGYFIINAPALVALEEAHEQPGH